jgi:FG-GAP-like repeat
MINNRKVKSLAFGFVLTLSCALTGQAQTTNGIAPLKPDGQSAAVLQTSQSPAIASGLSGIYYGSLRLADANGDGKADVCGRGIAGVYCALNHGNRTFGPVVLWTSQFNDATGWNQPQYGSTMMFADINGDGRADVCGRGIEGIYCKLSTGSGFGPIFLASSDFSDAQGWNQ